MPNKSISFNEEMIKAILDGRKTQTRRPHSEAKYQAGDIVQIENNDTVIKIINAKRERLITINKNDLIAEGIEDSFSIVMVGCFRKIWNAIYGNDEFKRWNANPWVWVYEFEVSNEN